MAQRTIAHLYDNYEDAVRVVRALEDHGIPSGDISLVARGVDSRAYDSNEPAGAAETGASSSTGKGTGAGLTLGTVVGGGAGLLAGLGALAIPGIGPIVAAGWLIATVTGAGVGAAAGGLVGSLTGAGLSESDAHLHAEGVRRGSSLVTVRADEGQSAEVERMMAQAGPVNLQSRSADYQAEGWSRFEDNAPPYSTPASPRVPPVTTE